MALYGVVSDIHGNREALLAVLTALERRGVERLLCLGDIVGYNADPDDCAALMRGRGALAIAGNHDLIGLGRLGFARCSDKAAHSLRRTRRRISAETRTYLASLPDRLSVEERVLLVHGGVRDVEQYMVGTVHIRENAAYARAEFPAARLCLYGHVHVQRAYELDGEEVRERPAEGRLALDPERLSFVNPGSVDASRRREAKLAEFALLDTGAWSVEFCRLSYDHALTEAKAALGGYRIGPWSERVYSLRRRLLRL